MEDFLKMDIFFVVTTIVAVALGVLVALILWRVYRILKDVEHISHNISEESDNLRNDVDHLRAKVREEGMKLAHITDFFSSIYQRASGRKKEK